MEGLIDRTCRDAKTLAKGLQEQGFEILNEVVLNQVVAALPEGQGWSSKLAGHVQKSGEACFGPTHWKEREAIRISISSWATTDADIQRTLDAMSPARTGFFQV